MPHIELTPVGSASLEPNSVKTANIENNAVTTAKLAEGAIGFIGNEIAALLFSRQAAALDSGGNQFHL